MLRILFINRMASMERGGGETFDLEMARHLAQMGHQITFLTGIPLFGEPRLPISATIGNRQSAIGIAYIRAPMFPWFPWDRVKAGWRVRVAEFWLFEKLAARWAWKRRDQFDIIQVCELPTFVSSIKSKIENRKSKMDARVGCRVPSVGCRVSEKGSEVSHSAIGNRQSALPRVVMRLTAPNVYDPSGGIQKADALIASGTSIDKIRQSKRPDCHNIPNAVDTERFRPHASDFRTRHGIATGDLVLLYVARFQDFKNHALLVKAFADVLREEPRARLVLAGSGPLQSDVRTKAGSLGIVDRIMFLGEVAFNELPDVYAAADIKVISSAYESFCFAAVEGMATGLPVVSTDCGWVPGLLGDTLPPIRKQWVGGGGEPSGRFSEDEDGRRIREVPGGLIVGRTEPASMAQAILALLRDEAKRRQMGAWNREKAFREHGWEASARKLEAVYYDLCK